MSQQRNTKPLGMAAAAVVLFTVVGAAGHVFLVQREEANAVAAAARADALEQDVIAAQRFIREHGDLEISPEAIDEVKERILTTIPRGRRDVEVVEFLRETARKLELHNFVPDLEGGMVVDATVDEDDTGLGPLASAPATLRRSARMSIQFAGTYQQTAEFLDALAKAPWLIEVGTVDVSRSVPRPGAIRQLSSTRNKYDLQVRMTARYVHRCVQEPCVDPNQQTRRRR